MSKFKTCLPCTLVKGSTKIPLMGNEHQFDTNKNEKLKKIEKLIIEQNESVKKFNFKSKNEFKK